MTSIGEVLGPVALEGLKLEVDRQVLTVTLNRPDRLNALNAATVSSLTRVWAAVGDTDIRAIIITGAGRGFCAGADLQGYSAAPGQPVGLRHSSNPHVLALANVHQVVIAAVNGPAAGAGLALACAADIRIASSTAKFVPAFVRAGVAPDAGATYFIPRLVGHARAVDWLLSGYELDAFTAVSWGLVSSVVEPPALLATATERARSLAAMPGTAMSLTKALLHRSTYSSLPEQLESEAAHQVFAIASPERAEARAATVARITGAPNRTANAASSP